MGIGIILQELIDTCNTNVKEISRETKVPASTIYSIIKRDNKNANISDLYKIAHHLGVTLDYFYEGNANSNISLSSHEKTVITAYRNQPDMQGAVDRLLGIQEEEKVVVFQAARSKNNTPPGYVEVPKSLIDKLKNAPDFDGDL
ncbi:MAG: helix-turn-helix transcriptional regulator [Eubacterium sp.]|nr:helix-turn-helix transcriptional regulator [Eubacterium sp.]